MGRIEMGVSGIDAVLGGGLLPRRAYLIRGGPGSGKTTLGLHFLTAGEGRGLFVSLGERAGQIRTEAEARGYDTDGLAILDLSPSASELDGEAPYDLFSVAEVERQPLMDSITSAVDEHGPGRVFIDSLTQLRYLADSAFQFRKQVLALLRYLTDRGATVLFSAEGGAEAPDDDLRFLSDGILEVSNDEEGRRFRVTKLRGSGYREGDHELVLGADGLTVHPRVEPDQVNADFPVDSVGSGVAAVDELLHGGVSRGTTTIITGPTGAGKTTLGVQFLQHAAARGERAVLYSFEEKLHTLRTRCHSIGLPMQEAMDCGWLAVHEIEALRYGPDEFANHVRHEVEVLGSRLVMLDSIAGYRLAVGGRTVVNRLHALARYLVGQGVTVLIINDLASIAGGELRATELGVSYLADTVVLLRYFEMAGELRKCIGVLKKRTGDFEKTLREFDIRADGIWVGEPLSGMRGILRGDPEMLGRGGQG